MMCVDTFLVICSCGVVVVAVVLVVVVVVVCISTIDFKHVCVNWDDNRFISEPIYFFLLSSNLLIFVSVRVVCKNVIHVWN